MALNGLILAGGRSSRMGTDKALIDYHGLPQFEYLTALLSDLTDNVFISCRKDQQDFFIHQQCNVITDIIEDAGPLGAVFSVLSAYPDDAWLIVACDVPLLDKSVLKQLISSRNSNALATAFISPHDGLPEPLIAIWENKSIDAVSEMVHLGKKCPRKVMLNHPVQLVECHDPGKLFNANFPHEMEQIKNPSNG